MTTTVYVRVEGNKICEALVQAKDLAQPPVEIYPGETKIFTIHGEQKLVVKEVGEFLS